MKIAGPAVVLACAGVAALALSVPARAQSDSPPASSTLDALESLLGWPAPARDAATDVRIMLRSELGVVPLPLVRLTSDANGQVIATVTEWGARTDRAHAGRPLAFAHPPVACAADRTLCAGTPRVIRSEEAKALSFALLIARWCNDRPRQVPTDAEDLFVRGRVDGVGMLFSCTRPNPKGAPADRQAAAVVRISHRLLGR